MDIQWTPSERKRLKFYLTIIDNNAVIEIQKPEKPGQALAVVGWLIVIVGSSFQSIVLVLQGWFVPTELNVQHQYVFPICLLGCV